MKLPKWIYGAAARLGIVLLLCLAPWPDLQRPFESGFRALANLVLPLFDFDTAFGEASAQLTAAARPDRDAASWDSSLVLSIDHPSAGKGRVSDVVVNVRRVAYLPFLGLLALIGAAPLRRPQRLRCLAIGSSAVLLYSVLSIWTTSQWLFAEIPGVVQGWSNAHRMFVHLAYRTLVVPTSNRYILPLLLAGLLIAFEKVREADGPLAQPGNTRRSKLRHSKATQS